MEEHVEASPPVIRSLLPSDAAAFRALRLQAVASSPFAIGPTHEEEAAYSIADTELRIRQTGTQVVFGAFVGGLLAGIAGLRREPLAQLRHKAVLWGVFVSPAQRGAGLARGLLARVLAHAREQGVLQVQLCVNAENDPARNLYLSLGFVPFGREPRGMRVGDRFFDDEHMVLRLDA